MHHSTFLSLFVVLASTLVLLADGSSLRSSQGYLQKSLAEKAVKKAKTTTNDVESLAERGFKHPTNSNKTVANKEGETTSSNTTQDSNQTTQSVSEPQVLAESEFLLAIATALAKKVATTVITKLATKTLVQSESGLVLSLEDANELESSI